MKYLEMLVQINAVVSYEYSPASPREVTPVTVSPPDAPEVSRVKALARVSKRAILALMEANPELTFIDIDVIHLCSVDEYAAIEAECLEDAVDCESDRRSP